MFAVIATGGKQFKVAEGDVIYVEKLNVEDGASVDFDVLSIVDGGKISVGADVSSAKVTGTNVKTGKKKKITVFKYKAKKNYRRKQGHRQPYTKVEIKSIHA